MLFLKQAIVKTNPISTTECDSYSNLGGCSSLFTNVSNMTPMTEAINEDRTPENSVSVHGNQYDAHYLVGNYYSWVAATAGSGGSITNYREAIDSICPAGWRLPSGQGASYEGSFYKLLNAYNMFTSSSEHEYATVAPLYFVTGGLVYMQYTSSRALNDAGGDAHYWSNLSERSDYSSNLYLFENGNAGNPSYSAYKSNGLSVRCIAKWE